MGWQAGRALRVIAISGVAICATGWGAFNMFATLHEAQLVGVVTRITEGDEFKAETLQALEPVMQDVSKALLPKPTLLRAVALIRLRQAELEVLTDKPAGDNPRLVLAEQSIRRAIAYMPADGFLWYALAWIMKYREGTTPAVLQALAMSYDTAPNEGWVAVHRNGFALSVFSDLSPQLRDDVVAEYRHLVTSNYTLPAATILAGPGWLERQRLLDALEDVPEVRRYDLYRALLDLDRDLPVPGVRRHADRPWRNP